MPDTSKIPGSAEVYDFASTLSDAQRREFFALIGDESTVPALPERMEFARTLSDAQRREFFALFDTSPRPVVDLDDFTPNQLRTELATRGSVPELKGVPADVLEAHLSGGPAPAHPARQPWQRPRVPRRPSKDSEVLAWVKVHVATIVLTVVGFILFLVFRGHLTELIGVTTPNARWWTAAGLFVGFLLLGGIIGNKIDRRNHPEYYDNES